MKIEAPRRLQDTVKLYQACRHHLTLPNERSQRPNDCAYSLGSFGHQHVVGLFSLGPPVPGVLVKAGVELDLAHFW